MSPPGTLQSYKERKLIISNQNKLFKELEKKRDKTPPPPPPRIGKATEEELAEEEGSSGSEPVIRYDAWHAKQFPWSDFVFEEVSSMPSSSNNPVNTGKAPMVQSEIEEDEASGSQYEDDDDDATEEDSE